jgi:hypothetical protein
MGESSVGGPVALLLFSSVLQAGGTAERTQRAAAGDDCQPWALI